MRLIPPRLALCTLTAVLFCAALGSARAQANLTLSGGSGTPFVLTLNTAVSYVINTAPTLNAPFFIFQNLGNVVGSQMGFTGTIVYSVNSGPNVSIASVNSGVAVGNIGANDLYIFGPSSTVAVGNVITLKAGTQMTVSNAPGTIPPNGNYATFITDGNGVRLSPNGTAVPEPATWSILLGGLSMLGCCLRLRRSA